jgi:3-oxoacyl-[acyl-carrier protein] reductase
MTQSIPAEVKEKFIGKIPMRRIGKPEDIAAIICFLASDEANYITGQCLQVDGGLTVGGAGG